MFEAHLVDAVLHHAAHGLFHQLLTVLFNLIHRFMVEGQTVGAVLNDQVHLLLQLLVERDQAVTHVAVAAEFFDNDTVNRHAAFFEMRRRALINPRQVAGQTGLIIDRFLTLFGAQGHVFTVEGDVAVGRNQ
ncbi:hypothetical protein D3C80_1778220 [compost metagenome]